MTASMRPEIEHPPIQISVTFTNRNPATIYNKLAAKLGREPTNAECKAEVGRILRHCESF